MLYLYDEAIVNDLKKSFNPDNVSNPIVKVYDPESVVRVVAQIKEDTIDYPIVTLQRHPAVTIDSDRSNFTWMHVGRESVFDKENNVWYNERAIPVRISYDLDVITTNTADMDEIIRELIFKYKTMYFLYINLPYECDRRARFGVVINTDNTINRQSSVAEYHNSGQLYRSTLQLDCEGCVLVHYTSIKLKRVDYQLKPVTSLPNRKRIAQ